MKLSLYKKGLIVIALILAFQVGLLALIAGMLAHSEKLTEQESYNRSIVGRCNWIAVLLSTANLSCLAYRMTGDGQFSDIYKGASQAVGEQLKGLQAEFAGHNDQEKRMAVCRDEIERLLAKLEGIVSRPPAAPYNSQDRTVLTQDLLPLWKHLYALRHELLVFELAKYEQDPLSRMPSGRKARNLFLVFLLLVNVSGAVGGFYIYTRKLTKRLEILSENTARFGKKQPLLEALPGTDEIADLDRVFHEVTASLTNAERRKQEYLSMLSHDLRTPLTSAQTSLEFVGEGHSGALSSEARTWLTSASTNIQTVLGLINELLEMERIESGMLTLQYEEIQVGELILSAVDCIRAIAQQKQITIATPRTDAYIWADFDRLQRVLVNLLGNAVKFSPQGSTITVGANEAESTIQFYVSDEGRGIPEEFLDKVFARFQQVTAEDARKLGGSGLGLSISKAIVEAHGGTIGVESIENKGTTFSFQIPKGRPDTGATPA